MKTDSRWVNSIELDVPFYDCDPMGIVWHGNYLKYFEVARAALLETVNFNYLAMAASGYLWPIVDIRVKYVHSCRLQQRLRITAAISEYEHRLRVDYQIADALSGEVMTKGHSIQVAVDQASGEMCFVSPPVLLERLGVAP